MPPKRKKSDESQEASSARSTRSSSSRTTANKNTSSSGTNTKKSTSRTKKATLTNASGADGDDSDGMESAPTSKKARTSGSTSTRRGATKASTGQRGQIDDDPIPNGKTKSKKELLVVPHPDVLDSAPPISAKPPPASKKITKYEPYTPQRALELFSKYADSDDPNLIGPEGFEQLCTDADMPLDGPRPIIFAWQMGSKEMANITKDEWVTGTCTLKISSTPQISLAITELEDMLMHSKPPLKATAKKDQEYDRTSYFAYSTNVKAAFQKLYLFAFSLAKPEQSKNIEMETSVAFWTVLLAPKYPVMLDVVQFINEKGTYKATNKDLWSMMLEFCETVSPSLDDYEADGAWPTLLDDFVIWKKSRADNGQTSTMDVDQ